MRELAGELRDEGDEGSWPARKREKKMEEERREVGERERIGNVYLIGEEREL